MPWWLRPPFQGGCQSNSGSASELSAAPDEGGLEHSAILQIGEEGGESLVEFRSLLAHGLEVVAVRVPAAGIVDDDVGHARLDHSACREAILPEGVASVAVAELGFLFREIEDLTSLPEIS